MNFNSHLDLIGKHAFLSASQYHWLNYDANKLAVVFNNVQAKERGTRLHSLACECITLGVKLPKVKKTLNLYVNDAIGYKMTPEQILFYSYNCFGTADTICFRQKLLRIHDLKTGDTPASMSQLEIYAALFCLEYNINPKSIGIELRIYQHDEALVHEPNPDDISDIATKIVMFDKQIEKMKIGE
ncbi:MAG: DUF2800 domain-containing protein [Lactococcus chungangensis]|nr:DUF2800 domain-containing protein [Lactococcus chungangensis]